MKSTSALWKQIVKDESHLTEVKVELYDSSAVLLETYGMDTLMSLKISQALIPDSVPAIGSAASSTCELTVLEDSANWPRMGKFKVSVRVVSEDGESTSEWLSMGTFYTDERSQKKSGALTIKGFDGMLLFEQSWTDKMVTVPASWPITCSAWADLMEEADIFEIDSSTTLDDTVSMIGLDTTSTVRDVLKTIAAAHGGNWIITETGTLRLVPFSNMSTGTAAIAGIAIAGVAIVGDSTVTVTNNAEYTYVGMHASSIDTGPAFSAITGVTLETAAGSTSTAGTSTGYVMKGDCEFSDSDGVAALALTYLTGYVYKPFDADKTYLNPAADVGDLVIIDGESYQMMTIDWTLNAKPTANISAPYEEEVDHEYTVVSAEAKTLRKALAATSDLETRVYSSIEQTEASIITQVGETYETQSDAATQYATLQTTITQTKDALEVEVQSVTDDLDELRMHYRFDDTGETIGKTGSAKSVQITNEQISLKAYDDPVVYINQDKMVAPHSLEIPVGGDLTLGYVMWKPRSGGNVSEVWVGE